MPLIKYLGSGIRQVSPADLEQQGIYDHEAVEKDFAILIDTTQGDETDRTVEVTDAVATALTEREPDDWYRMNQDEELAYWQQRNAAEKQAAEAQAAIDAERAEVQANRERAAQEEERRSAGVALPEEVEE